MRHGNCGWIAEGRSNWIDRQQEEEKVLKKNRYAFSGSEFWYGWRQFYLWNDLL